MTTICRGNEKKKKKERNIDIFSFAVKASSSNKDLYVKKKIVSEVYEHIKTLRQKSAKNQISCLFLLSRVVLEP